MIKKKMMKEKNFKIVFTPPPNNQKFKDRNFMHLLPNLGLLYLISETKKYFPDISTEYFEGKCFMKEYAEEIVRKNPDVLAISISFFNSTEAIAAINEIKKRMKKIFIVAGGPYATTSPELILLKSKVDVCVLGEGERTFVEILRFLKGESSSLSHVDGIAFRKNSEIIRTPKRALEENINRYPFPYWDAVEIKDYPGYFYQKKRPEMFITSSRGCPFNCNFCSNPVWKLSMPWKRFRSPKNIREEIRTLVGKYGIKEIYDWADEFNIDLEWAEKVSREIRHLGLDSVVFKCMLHASRVNEKLANSLERMGTWFVHLGIESGNQETLNGIGKNLRISQVRNACRILKRHKMKIGGFFMLYHVWEKDGSLHYETTEQVNNTLSFAEKLMREGLLDYITWGFLIPTPGSRAYETCKKFNLLKNRNAEEYHYDEILYSLPGVPESEMRNVKFRGMILEGINALKHGNLNLKQIRYIFQRVRKMADYLKPLIENKNK